MRIVAWMVVGVTASVAAGRAMAQADPALILRESAAALAEVRVLSFKAESQGTGVFAASEPLVRASVSIDGLMLGRPERWTAAIRGTIAMPDPAQTGRFESYIDAGDAMVFKHATKEIISGRSADASGILEDGGGREAVWWLIEWPRAVGPAAAPGGGQGARALYAGQRSVAGELCHVIRVDASAVDDVETDSWWFISMGDRLPRRVDRLIHTDRGSGVVSVVLSEVKTGGPLDSEEFRRAIPLEYEAKEYRPGMTAPKYRPRTRSPLAVGTLAPDFELMTSGGQQRRLTDARERVVVLSFWASWSKPCAALLGRLDEIARTREGKPLTVWALSTGDVAEAPRVFRDLGVTFEMLMQADAYARRVAVGDLPATVVIGPDGRVAALVSGGGDAEVKAITGAVDAALRGMEK